MYWLVTVQRIAGPTADGGLVPAASEARGRAVALQVASSFSWSSAWLPGSRGDHGQPVAGQVEGVTGQFDFPDHSV
jgi:hypothetical protein